LGVCPYFKNIEKYPLDKEGKSMIFLAQINLTDLAELENMPEKGLLQSKITWINYKIIIKLYEWQ